MRGSSLAAGVFETPEVLCTMAAKIDIDGPLHFHIPAMKMDKE